MYKKLRAVLCITMLALLAASVTASALYSVGAFKSGNNSKYDTSTLEKAPDSTLTDETIVFLGSNLLTGSKASGDTFVEYLKQSDGINAAVYAREGATLIQSGRDSLVSLIETIPTKDANPAMLVCEIPYADGAGRSRIGKLTEGFYDNEYKTRTVIGAMEYIISYSQSKWGCPVVFFTCLPNDVKHYEKIMDAARQVADKWNVEIIDFYNDPLMVLDDEKRALYMASDANPTKAGYKELFTPKFREFLLKKIY